MHFFIAYRYIFIYNYIIFYRITYFIVVFYSLYGVSNMTQELPLKAQIELTQPELLLINEALSNQLSLTTNENVKNICTKITNVLIELDEIYYGSSDAVSSDEPPYSAKNTLIEGGYGHFFLQCLNGRHK